MAFAIGVPKETVKGENRIPVVPEVGAKFKSLGADLCVERGAGAGSHFLDEEFGQANIVANAAEVYARSQVIFKVQVPSYDEIRSMRTGTILIGFLRPYEDPERARLLCEKKITSFAVELIPRISRAQSMDALTSQSTVAGYLSALIAAENCPKFFPMITFAAGTLRPARVLVVGVGVAGLQSMATAHRLGAIVEAYDVRSETREQAESVGARFVDIGVSASGTGGYARELTIEEKKLQREKLAKVISQVDVLITTAALPGKKSPLIITEDMVAGMRRGAVIVDMAAEGGGNVAGTRAGETVVIGGVTIFGPVNLPSRMPIHASEMYSKNLYNFLSPHIKDGNLSLDWSDEIIAGSAFTHEAQIRSESVKRALGL
ncbi:MAG: NAD(P) transhydrogenase subunit alpha [Thermodesulfovibrionales bacterium]|jgi:NAD(P) transhydrogenase subunit alpha